MKAIQTRYVPASDTKPSRIIAKAEGVKSLSISYPHDLSGDAVYAAAAMALCKRQGWNYSWVAGGLPNGDVVFCCSEHPDVRNNPPTESRTERFTVQA